MWRNPSLRSLFLIWMGWLVVICGFQTLAVMRIDLARPDNSLYWTARETLADSHARQPYLVEPFLNGHVAWDSEFYLSMALVGYDDPLVRSVASGGPPLSLSYAFMPVYPFVIRVVAWPLQFLGLGPIAAASLAGVLVSALGALAGMVALYDLTSQELGEAGGIRTAFYLLIFPTGFFMAQVYTEGLFAGLAFSALALLRRGRLPWAAVLAVLATLTRAAGVALVLPMALPWIMRQEWTELDLDWRQIYTQGLPWKSVGKAVLVFSPLLAYLAWKVSPLGLGFGVVQANFFGRGFLAFGPSFANWAQAAQLIGGPNSQASAYYLVEFGAIILGFAACAAVFRKYPYETVFSLAVILLSLGSGPAQGMHRYVLGAPAVFLALGRWGSQPAFDRVWSLLSILLMALLAITFTFDFWAG